MMHFYQSAFPEKGVLENIPKKVRFWGNYPSTFTLLRVMTPICFKHILSVTIITNNSSDISDLI